MAFIMVLVLHVSYSTRRRHFQQKNELEPFEMIHTLAMISSWSEVQSQAENFQPVASEDASG